MLNKMQLIGSARFSLAYQVKCHENDRGFDRSWFYILEIYRNIIGYLMEIVSI